jgi:hypothetical protein
VLPPLDLESFIQSIDRIDAHERAESVPHICSLLHKNFCAAFHFGALRQAAWLPASVIRGRAAGPATASVNT